MKRFYEYWREALCLTSFCLFFASLWVWMLYPPNSEIGKYIFVAFGFCDIFVFVYFLRWIWINKWKNRLHRFNEILLEKMTSFFSRVFEKLMNKWNFGGKKKNVIIGKTKIIFDAVGAQKEELQHKKAPKWKHLQSDKERLRFLYRAMINNKVRRGEKIYSYDTPCELKERSENTANEERLFSVYIGSRYYEDAVICEDEVQSLKDDLGNEFTIR